MLDGSRFYRFYKLRKIWLLTYREKLVDFLIFSSRLYGLCRLYRLRKICIIWPRLADSLAFLSRFYRPHKICIIRNFVLPCCSPLTYREKLADFLIFSSRLYRLCRLYGLRKICIIWPRLADSLAFLSRFYRPRKIWNLRSVPFRRRTSRMAITP